MKNRHAPPSKADHTIEKAITHHLETLCAVSMLLIVAVTFLDVLGRYVFNKPLWGAAEYIQFAMAITIFSGLPLITRQREHVSVDLLNSLPLGWARVKRLLVDGASLLIMLVLARQLFVQALDYAEVGTGTTVLNMPMAPLAVLLGLLASLTALTLVRMIGHTLVTGEQP